MPIDQVIALVARDGRELANLQSMKIDSSTLSSLDLSPSVSVKYSYDFPKSSPLIITTIRKVTPFKKTHDTDQGAHATTLLSAGFTTVSSKADEVRKVSRRLLRHDDRTSFLIGDWESYSKEDSRQFQEESTKNSL